MANKRNGHAVENYVERKLIVEALIYSGLIFLYVIVFSVCGVFFITADAFWQLLLGSVFILPPVIMVSAKAKTIGERDYRIKNRTVLTDIHSQKIVKVNSLKGLLYIAPFMALSLLLTLIAEIAKIQAIQGIMLILFMPTTLLFQGVGLLSIKRLSWYSMLSISVMVIIISVAFFVGYYLGIRSMRTRNEEMINEIRSFE